MASLRPVVVPLPLQWLAPFVDRIVKAPVCVNHAPDQASAVTSNRAKLHTTEIIQELYQHYLTKQHDLVFGWCQTQHDVASSSLANLSSSVLHQLDQRGQLATPMPLAEVTVLLSNLPAHLCDMDQLRAVLPVQIQTLILDIELLSDPEHSARLSFLSRHSAQLTLDLLANAASHEPLASVKVQLEIPHTTTTDSSNTVAVDHEEVNESRKCFTDSTSISSTLLAMLYTLNQEFVYEWFRLIRAMQDTLVPQISMMVSCRMRTEGFVMRFRSSSESCRLRALEHHSTTFVQGKRKHDDDHNACQHVLTELPHISPTYKTLTPRNSPATTCDDDVTTQGLPSPPKRAKTNETSPSPSMHHN